jgi:hypothetical protein
VMHVSGVTRTYMVSQEGTCELWHCVSEDKIPSFAGWIWKWDVPSCSCHNLKTSYKLSVPLISNL